MNNYAQEGVLVHKDVPHVMVAAIQHARVHVTFRQVEAFVHRVKVVVQMVAMDIAINLVVVPVILDA